MVANRENIREKISRTEFKIFFIKHCYCSINSITIIEERSYREYSVNSSRLNTSCSFIVSHILKNRTANFYEIFANMSISRVVYRELGFFYNNTNTLSSSILIDDSFVSFFISRTEITGFKFPESFSIR